MTLNVGIAGAGRMGSLHAANLKTIPGVRVVAVADVDGEKARALAAKHDARVHLNARTMIETEKLDALYVALPPYAHGDLEKRAAASKVHLYVEPPVHLTLEKALAACGAIEAAGIVTATGYDARYRAATDVAKKLLEKRRVALVVGTCMLPPCGAEWWGERAKSGGDLFVRAGHLVDLARYLVGEPVRVAAAAAEPFAADGVDNIDLAGAEAVLMDFRRKAAGVFTSSHLVGGRARTADSVELRIVTDAGVIVLEGDATNRRDLASDATLASDKAFIAAAKKGDQNLVRASYTEGVRTLEVLTAARESIETRKTVEL